MPHAREPTQLAVFLTALRAKGETPAELGGMLDALMDRVIPLPVDGSAVTDVVGTGAGGDAACNAKVVRAVAAGVPGPVLDAILANAAGALAARNGAGGTEASEDAFAAGLDQARTAVSSGAAARLLDQWIALAAELASPR